MAEYLFAIKQNVLDPGEMTSLDLSGREVLIARIGDTFYAADNRCPHLGGNLSRGKLTGHIITCPLHKSQFDLTSGDVIRWTSFKGVVQSINLTVRKPHPLTVYPVVVVGEDVMVEM